MAPQDCLSIDDSRLSITTLSSEKQQPFKDRNKIENMLRNFLVHD